MRTPLIALLALAAVACDDAGPANAVDAGTRDAAPPDARPDARAVDAAPPRDAAVDAAPPDATADAVVVADAAPLDAAPLDAAVPDAAPPDAEAPTADAVTPVDPVGDPDGPGPEAIVEAAVMIPVAPGRTLAARVYRPAGDAPRPLVVLLHGFQLAGDNYAGHGRRLASHGFIALLPSMGDGLLNPLSHVQLAADVSTILDWAEANLPGVDAARIGAMGHSRGGKQVILAALRDARIRAVFGLDPVDAAPPFVVDPVAYPSVAPELMGDLAIPAAFIGAGLGAQAAFPGAPACAPDGENHAAYFASTGGPAWDYLLPRAGHLDFTDDCGLACFGCVAGDDPAAARAFGWRTSVAFFKVHLLGDEGWRPYLEGPPVAAAGAVLDRR